MIDKETVKNNFSKYARYYDRYSSVQDLCASKLISRIKADAFNEILDVGCGTGNYTRLLRMRFPEARISAIDISRQMIEVAKGKLEDKTIEFRVADGEEMDFKEKFDLISSNATFQWFEDLEKSLSGYKEALKGGGTILFSTFGPLTFCELDNSLKELAGGDTAISASNFFERKVLERILKNLFREIKVEQKIYRKSYNSLPGLLKSIKYTGTRGNGMGKKNFWTSRKIAELEKIYRRRSKNITATYQVFFCKGIK